MQHEFCMITLLRQNLSFVLGLHGFGSRGASGVASVRSCPKLLPCPAELSPAGSRTDTLLAKAEAIRNGGSTFMVTY